MSAVPTAAEVDRGRRFGGIARLYGQAALDALMLRRACVVGVGGVGSWVAETLARSGVGCLRLVDLDHVAESNINRQIHALEPTLGQAKVLAMRDRIAAINPGIAVEVVEEFLTPANAAALVAGCDVVIDAVDDMNAKLALVLACRAARVPLVVCGGAGGKTDPTRIRVDDLARATHDPLLSRLRRRLRAEHGFPREPKRRFAVTAVYSEQPPLLPDACDAAPQGLACAGYGSSMAVTASFGLFAASRALDALFAPAHHDMGEHR
ncbi:tRNA threonylcarbamoyladenosine dehydratase [Pseudazoarcus pumilus]|uniref:tRNA cyclic N6-threonylcarbamoyladenosine(37) synthase TcdA n=1 Tax=Pseudazoarcus pumilus TaxID=2067960 RepID=A0A2I6S465_9RHOO|nr:tRNA threonylcarbamoyladenosine dehydratase [Pseudazoarcus pumilus]AUN94035.1 tRNA cyclic N6-threonylcarbamoyladenosine(37) synthase TcdA [Pseudazoarcus pumilus]